MHSCGREQSLQLCVSIPVLLPEQCSLFITDCAQISSWRRTKRCSAMTLGIFLYRSTRCGFN